MPVLVRASKTFGVHRQIVLGSTDSLNAQPPAADGEALFLLQEDEYHDIAVTMGIDRYVCDQLGIDQPRSMRHAGIFHGTVVQLCLIDPSLDTGPAFIERWVQSEVAELGDTYDPGTGQFTAPDGTVR